MIINTNWTNEELNETLAKLRYITQKICKRNFKTKKWIVPRFEDIVWIIAVANYRMCQRYCMTCINLDIFNFIEDGYNFTPNEFKFKDKNWQDLISEADKEVLNSACFHWKLYGQTDITLTQYFQKFIRWIKK